MPKATWKKELIWTDSFRRLETRMADGSQQVADMVTGAASRGLTS